MCLAWVRSNDIAPRRSSVRVRLPTLSKARKCGPSFSESETVGGVVNVSVTFRSLTHCPRKRRVAYSSLHAHRRDRHHLRLQIRHAARTRSGPSQSNTPRVSPPPREQAVAEWCAIRARRHHSGRVSAPPLRARRVLLVERCGDSVLLEGVGWRTSSIRSRKWSAKRSIASATRSAG